MAIRIRATTWNATNGIQFSIDGDVGGFICLKDAETVADLAANDQAQRNARIVQNKINNARSRSEREELTARLARYQQQAGEATERIRARAIGAASSGYARPDFGASMDEPFLG